MKSALLLAGIVFIGLGLVSSLLPRWIGEPFAILTCMIFVVLGVMHWYQGGEWWLGLIMIVGGLAGACATIMMWLVTRRASNESQ